MARKKAKARKKKKAKKAKVKAKRKLKTKTKPKKRKAKAKAKTRKAKTKKVKKRKPEAKKTKAEKRKTEVKKPVKALKPEKRKIEVLDIVGKPFQPEMAPGLPSEEIVYKRGPHYDKPEEEKKIEKTSDDFYDQDERQEMLEEDSMHPDEVAFMEGFENPHLIECDNCGQKVNLARVIEWKINGKSHWFCTQGCLENFLKKKRKT